MELDWYDFGESTLLATDYKPYEAKLVLTIDGRMTIDNPRSRTVKKFEDYWEVIEIVLNGVRCCDFIRSPHMKWNNEDLGDIYSLVIYQNQNVPLAGPWFHDVSLDYIKGEQRLHGIHSPIAKQYCEFVSDSLAFVAGFEWLLLKAV
ncbi:MAG: hypothetical protein K6T81_19620 [Alicyclobacillus macrosporangiidus]|uniref:hypothetical protein n=1 Tax=Alicyclobacillus macrosporangiidus TaxID=392015 RepID=UPI0026EF6C6C|nr:hypothetical protein [Alicyclobacillus macrosporangiidus]MCL6600920.1 hypothetical protein [Alicyclobacillus macrosporangiidus]